MKQVSNLGNLGGWSLSWLLVWSLFLTSGCGYRLKHELDPILRKKKSVSVPVFGNLTEHIGMAPIFTNALVQELQSRGQIKIVGSQESELSLEGTISSISVNPVAFTATGYGGLRSFKRLPTEYAIEVYLNLKLVDNENQQVVWNRQFRGFRRVDGPIDRSYDFQVPSSLNLQVASLVENMHPQIARDIMRDVYDTLVELF